MVSYVCVELVGGSCASWVVNSSILDISIEEGVEIGFSFFFLAVLAWGCRSIAKVLLNKM